MKCLLVLTLIFTGLFGSSGLHAQSDRFIYNNNAVTELGYKREFYGKPSGIKFYYLENFLPKGYSKRGDVDYTEVIQAALKKYRNVIFPNFSILVDDKGLYIYSNSVLYFQNNSRIIAKPSVAPRKDFQNIKEWYDILRIYDQRNVRLYNVNVKGDRKNHVGNVGEWGAGIGIRNSTNIYVYGAEICDTWGEGIFIGSENGGVCKNVRIRDVWVDNARRNGMAITSAIGVYLYNIYISNTNGTAPEAGLDIEPSWDKDSLDNIQITKLRTFNNENAGLLFVLRALASNQIRREINILVDDFIDKNSLFSVGYAINVDGQANVGPIGAIEFLNSKGINPRSGNFILEVSKDKTLQFKSDGLQFYKNNIKQAIRLR